MKKTILYLYIVLLSPILAQSQITNMDIRPLSYDTVNRLETDTVIPLKKRPWVAVGEVFSLNVGIWAFDRYVLQGDWAYISLNTMKHNLEMGFHWDNDNFTTNLFSHPYHGSLYYGAARSNGMNYWYSGLMSLGGSTMWELFMECELPSTNDLIATSVGGMALGETLYRFSDMFLDDRSTGFERFGREALGLIFSPSTGLTRILTGQAWKSSTKKGKQYPQTNFVFQSSMGLKVMELKDDVFDEGMGACVDLGMIYGNLYETDGTKPYDYFTLRGSFNLQKHQPFLGQVNLMGRLWGEELYSSKNFHLFLGAYQHYDYYDSDTISDISNKRPYEVGTPACFGAGIVFKGKNSSETLKYWGHLHTNGILLGGSMSDYYFHDERGYNWGSGYSIKVGAGFSYNQRLIANIGFENYRIYTWKGYPVGIDPNDPNYDFRTANAQGDESNASFNVLNSAIGYNFNKKWGVIFNQYLFVRRTNYTFNEDVSSTTTENRLMLTYKF